MSKIEHLAKLLELRGKQIFGSNDGAYHGYTVGFLIELLKNVENNVSSYNKAINEGIKSAEELLAAR